MGEAKRKKQKIKEMNHRCIFCGGEEIATTEDHCPPKAVFEGKHAPEHFTFPACEKCNYGTSDDDLLVSFLSKVSQDKDNSGLIKAIRRQFPNLIEKMLNMGAFESRVLSKKFGLQRISGHTYRENGIVNVTDEMQKAVETLACKLSKAIYFKETKNIFPLDGAILFQWFTNAQKFEYGSIAILDGLAHINKHTRELVRNKKKLHDQFDYGYSVNEEGDLHLFQAVFRDSFGFVTIFSQTTNYLENMRSEIMEEQNLKNFPFQFLKLN